MSEDRNERIHRRAYEIWQQEGGIHGGHEQHWHQASAEIDSEGNEPMERDDARTDDGSPDGAPGGPDVLDVETLAIRTGITGDQAQALTDTVGSDEQALDQAATFKPGNEPRSTKAGKRKGP